MIAPIQRPRMPRRGRAPGKEPIPCRPSKWLRLIAEMEALARYRQPHGTAAGKFAYFGAACAGSLTAWNRRAAREELAGMWVALPGDSNCRTMARRAFERASEPKTTRIIESLEVTPHEAAALRLVMLDPAILAPEQRSLVIRRAVAGGGAA